MTRSRLWRELEAGDTGPLRNLRRGILLCAGLFLCWTATLPLNWQQQLVLAFVTLAVAGVMNRASRSHVVTLTLVLLSVYSTLRYGIWRVSTAVNYFRDPGSRWTALEAFFIWMLLLAECYAILVLVLGYLQTLWPLRRSPVPLPNEPEEWPSVDLLIPTYNEPLSVVRFTALAAMNIDWPADKLNVYILDDGKREEFRAFAEEAGVGYIARDDNANAKAGNINHALERLHSPFVAVFDCDHVPTRSFLQLTMGWFLRDPKLGVLQTPQRAYSPDPFERNLGQFHITPNEDELFYGVVQDGNDFWNAAFFCGSCAVLRREALDDAGGVAVETVTEDAHTSLRMQMRGWNSAYINIPQAAGLANERLSSHIRQRIRWARGMVQILRIENPLFARGLKPAQRLCYFNAMSHFLYALPRLIFLTAPVIYLIFGIRNLPGFWLAIVAYALPHLILSGLTNSRIQGEHRHSFWNEIYETVLAPYILLPTLGSLIWPRSAAFHVTPKGGVIHEGYFDARIARPFLLLAGFNFAALLCAVARFIQFPVFAAGQWLSFLNWPASLYDRGHAGTILVNVIWAVFNLVILGVATGVAWESQQRRRAVRVALAVPSDVILADGSMVQGMTCDLSSSGVRTTMNQSFGAQAGDPIQFVFPVLDGSATLPARIVKIDGSELRARFESLSLQEDEALTMILYSRADAWVRAEPAHERDRPARSMSRIVRLSVRGLLHAIWRPRGRDGNGKSRLATTVIPMLLLALAAAYRPRSVYAAPVTANALPSSNIAASSSSATNPPGFASSFSLSEAGAPGTIDLRGSQAARSVSFSLPQNEEVRDATLRLRYRFSPTLSTTESQITVSLNGSSVATVAATADMGATSVAGMLEAAIKLPAESLKHNNTLTFHFVGQPAEPCGNSSDASVWAAVDGGSRIELAGEVSPLANDLGVLPSPFLDSSPGKHAAVPIIFLGSPSFRAIQAAGVIASWLGELAAPRPVEFSVSAGAVPPGNAILLVENPPQLAALPGLAAPHAPAVTMLTNPADSSSKLLVISGDGPNQLLTAARALVLHGATWQGPQIVVRDLELPPERAPDDAPRWLSQKQENEGSELAGDLQGDGSSPISIYFRLPPDLSFGDRQNLAFHLSYRYNGVPLGDGSTLQVYVNGAYVSSTPMPHTDGASPVLETIVPIPVVDLRPFSNTITFQFAFNPAKSCGLGMPTNLQGAILKDSHLDISGFPHSAMLPNLELFANAGYPFTRRADLAGTSVILPDQPTLREIELFLALMGHFGAQTGYPGLRVTVSSAAGISDDGRQNYLLIGAARDQPALTRLASSLPIQVTADGLQVQNAAGQGVVSLQSEGTLPDAILEETEWPRGSDRTVVAVVPRDDGAVAGFIEAFLAKSQTSEVAGSVSILHGDRFSSYAAAGASYRIGDASLLDRAAGLFEGEPWLIAAMSVFCCFLMAGLMQAMLRRHARVRLQPEE